MMTPLEPLTDAIRRAVDAALHPKQAKITRDVHKIYRRARQAAPGDPSPANYPVVSREVRNLLLELPPTEHSMAVRAEALEFLESWERAARANGEPA